MHTVCSHHGVTVKNEEPATKSHEEGEGGGVTVWSNFNVLMIGTALCGRSERHDSHDWVSNSSCTTGVAVAVSDSNYWARNSGLAPPALPNV